MTALTLGSVLTASHLGLRRGFAAGVAVWTMRARSRRHLKHLDAHLLRDIGLDAERARREIARPFWD